MKSINTWGLTNNKLHQLFKNNDEFISLKVRGNTWEPVTRWMKLDSRIFKETTNRARITLCDLESLAEIYNYRSIRWKAKKLTPIPTKIIPESIKNILRKLPILRQLAFELEIIFYKYQAKDKWKKITKQKAIETMGKACNNKYGVKFFEKMHLIEIENWWNNYIHTAFID